MLISQGWIQHLRSQWLISKSTYWNQHLARCWFQWVEINTPKSTCAICWFRNCWFQHIEINPWQLLISAKLNSTFRGCKPWFQEARFWLRSRYRNGSETDAEMEPKGEHVCVGTQGKQSFNEGWLAQTGSQNIAEKRPERIPKMGPEVGPEIN